MMRNLMLDLLDLAQMESKTIRIHNEFFNLFEVIGKAFLLAEHIALEKNI